MGQKDTHLGHYQRIRKDAYRTDLADETRTESFFLAAFHVIDACAAVHGLHIGKHQNVRHELEATSAVFGERTRSVWTQFQEIENRVRIRIVYGSEWEAKDLRRAQELFEGIERVCLEVLG